MTTLKYINYFNLVYGTILLWTYVESKPLSYDYYLITGLILTLWYNWETLKKLRGQKNKLNKPNYVIGILTIVFGTFLFLSSWGMIKQGTENNNIELVIMGALYILLGLTTTYLTTATLKLYKR